MQNHFLKSKLLYQILTEPNFHQNNIEILTYRGLISATNSDTVESPPDESNITEGTSDAVALFVIPLGHSLVKFSEGNEHTVMHNI